MNFPVIAKHVLIFDRNFNVLVLDLDIRKDVLCELFTYFKILKSLMLDKVNWSFLMPYQVIMGIRMSDKAMHRTVTVGKM